MIFQVIAAGLLYVFNKWEDKGVKVFWLYVPYVSIVLVIVTRLFSSGFSLSFVPFISMQQVSS